MTPEAFFYIIEILLTAGFLVWFFARPWQSFCVDISRQRYFELRDKLFFLAMNEKISFDDPVYKAFREWLNNKIRLAHANRFGDMVAILIVHKGVVPKTPTLADELAKVGDVNLRAEMQEMYSQAIQIQIGHMAVRSPIILVLTVLTPFIILTELISGGVRVCLRWIANLAQVADNDISRRHMVEQG